MASYIEKNLEMILEIKAEMQKRNYPVKFPKKWGEVRFLGPIAIENLKRRLEIRNPLEFFAAFLSYYSRDALDELEEIVHSAFGHSRKRGQLLMVLFLEIAKDLDLV